MAPIIVGSLLDKVYPRAQCLDLCFSSILIYVNDSHDVVFHSSTKLFVDDVAIYKTINTSEDSIQSHEDLT